MSFLTFLFPLIPGGHFVSVDFVVDLVISLPCLWNICRIAQ